MSQLESIAVLVRGGRFTEALRAVDQQAAGPRTSPDLEVARMELLERKGAHDASRSIAERLLRNRDTSLSHRSACEFVLGVIGLNGGDSVAATMHLQRSVSSAQAANDLARTCWAQLRLMVALAGRTGVQSVAPLLAQARWNTIKLGDPIVLAALHLFVGGMEARRGLIESARRHTQLGQTLLTSDPNLWLGAVAENNHVGLALIQSDLESGRRHAEAAVALAIESGDAAVYRACLGNLGNLCCLAGDFAKTIEYFEQANRVLPSAGEYSAAAHETLARIHLLQNQVERANDHLDLFDRLLDHRHDRLLYASRHGQLTRVQVLQRQGHLVKALRLVESVRELADETDDRLLSVASELYRFELLAQSNQPAEMTLDPNKLHSSPPDVHAHYERALACGLARTGQLDAARAHLARGRRIYEGLDSAPGLLEINRAWEEAVLAGGSLPAAGPEAEGATSVDPNPAGNLLHDVSLLMMHAGRPQLVARHLVAILAASGSASSAVAVARKDDGAVEILASYTHGADPADVPERLRILPVGAARGRLIELHIRARRGLAAMSTVDAVTLLVASARELERAQAEREQSQTLWPIEELAVEQQRAIVTGRMTEVMALAQKVARTSASVLITGESGTGKEIVARSIHDHSARSDRPFVPFNCTAVPRDMLESQLFGHRRGAFTGADRDYPGLIRTARDGTLFLDEIGEMGLDLQPKLLRFLESGEISPLGEPGPVRVDVRIVAATNADLEHLVRTGRFREDLFYRLNVIPLVIPPLRERRDEIPALVHHFVARAAAEFSKGRVRVADETIEYLQLHPWPGNVRQLQNEVRRMVALADSDSVLTPAALAPEVRRARSKARARGDGEGELTVALSDKLAPTLARIEKEMIREALRSSHGRVDAAAKELGISRKGLYLKRQRLGL